METHCTVKDLPSCAMEQHLPHWFPCCHPWPAPHLVVAHHGDEELPSLAPAHAELGEAPIGCLCCPSGALVLQGAGTRPSLLHHHPRLLLQDGRWVDRDGGREKVTGRKRESKEKREQREMGPF